MAGSELMMPHHAAVNMLGFSRVPQVTSTAGTGASSVDGFQICFATGSLPPFFLYYNKWRKKAKRKSANFPTFVQTVGF